MMMAIWVDFFLKRDLDLNQIELEEFKAVEVATDLLDGISGFNGY